MSIEKNNSQRFLNKCPHTQRIIKALSPVWKTPLTIACRAGLTVEDVRPVLNALQDIQFVNYKDEGPYEYYKLAETKLMSKERILDLIGIYTLTFEQIEDALKGEYPTNEVYCTLTEMVRDGTLIYIKKDEETPYEYRYQRAPVNKQDVLALIKLRKSLTFTQLKRALGNIKFDLLNEMVEKDRSLVRIKREGAYYYEKPQSNILFDQIMRAIDTSNRKQMTATQIAARASLSLEHTMEGLHYLVETKDLTRTTMGGEGVYHRPETVVFPPDPKYRVQLQRVTTEVCEHLKELEDQAHQDVHRLKEALRWLQEEDPDERSLSDFITLLEGYVTMRQRQVGND